MSVQILGKFRRDEDAAGRESCCGLSHPEYRALVLRRAASLPGENGARKMFLAERDVKRALKKSGTTIEIPGARPGRRTI